MNNAADIDCVMKVTLEQLYNGAVRKLSVRRKVVCDLCYATGIHEQYYTCDRCLGIGSVSVNINSRQRMRVQCYACGGNGQTNRCKACDGTRFSRQCFPVEVNVGKGSCGGEIILLGGYGHQDINRCFGDLVITLSEIEHPIFKRDKHDLSTTINLDFTESLCGFKKLIKTLDNRQLVVTSEPGRVYASGDIQYLMNRGMTIYESPAHKGNLIVHFEVGKMNNKIATKHVPTIEKCLPQREKLTRGVIDGDDCNMIDVGLPIRPHNPHRPQYLKFKQVPEQPPEEDPQDQHSQNEDTERDNYADEAMEEVFVDFEAYSDDAGQPSSEPFK